MKDGKPLTSDGSSHYFLTQTITDRASSTFSNVLAIRYGVSLAGIYTCNVSNELGSDSSELVVGEVKLSCDPHAHPIRAIVLTISKSYSKEASAVRTIMVQDHTAESIIASTVCASVL